MKKMKKYKLYVVLLLFYLYFCNGKIGYQEIKEKPKSVINKIIVYKNKENIK